MNNPPSRNEFLLISAIYTGLMVVCIAVSVSGYMLQLDSNKKIHEYLMCSQVEYTINSAKSSLIKPTPVKVVTNVSGSKDVAQ